VEETRVIFCVQCNKEVEARLTDGREIYPHRLDLDHLPFWKCDACGNYVGCHPANNSHVRRYDPLGNIPPAHIRQIRRKVHAVLDPMWKSVDRRAGMFGRSKLYAKLSDDLGYSFHTGSITTMEEAEKVLALLEKYKQEKLVEIAG
jgi:hypothetical protein